MGKSMKLGGGGRFAALEKRLAKKGADSPGALSAWIGARRYGRKKMSKWASQGRKRAK